KQDRRRIVMTQPGPARSGNLQPIDPIWTSVRTETAAAASHDPLLAAFLSSAILNQPSLEAAVMHCISERLAHQDLGGDLIRQAFAGMAAARPEWSNEIRVDIQA